MPSEAQIIKDLQDFTVRLQTQITKLTKQLDDISLSPTQGESLVPSDNFEERVWESVLSSVIANMLNPSQLMPSDPTAQQKMMTRALHMADKWVEAARKYKQEKELAAKDAEVKDPIKELLDK